MKRLNLIAASAVLAATASAALAGSATDPRYDASQYSASEVAVIENALRNGDTQTAKFYIDGGNRTATTDAVTPGRAQIAAKLGLDPAQYTLSELSIIDSALTAKNTTLADFYISGRNRDIRGGVGEVSEGKAQLAAALRVNAADYSLNQLTAMYLDSIS